MSEGNATAHLLIETTLRGRHLIEQALDFLRRQPCNFKVIVARAAFSTFLTGLTSPVELHFL